MSGFLEKYRCRIETLSPIHIGDGGELTSMDYVFSENNIYVIDYDKLYEKLEKNNLLEKFIKFVEEATGKKGLIDFLNLYGLFHRKVLEEVSAYTLGYLSRERRSTNIATCMKNLEKKPYIPGSEVKGAIRIALLSDILLRDNDVKNKVILGLSTGYLKSETIDRFLRPKSETATGDLGRLMRVSDSLPLDTIGVAGMFRVSTRITNTIPLTLAEIIPPNASTYLELTIIKEKKILQELGDDISIEKIINACRSKSKKIIELQKTKLSQALEKAPPINYYRNSIKNLDDFYSNLSERFKKLNHMETLLRIGGGQGLLSTTVLSSLIEENEFKTLISSSFAKEKDAPHYIKLLKRLLTPINQRPFNIKTVEVDGVYMPLGWVKVRFEKI